jgi:hypothetical protein
VNNRQRFWFYVTVIAFPFFFVLHGVNEHFGLIRFSVIAVLFVYYLAISIAAATLSRLVMKNVDRATVFTFFLLCLFFFFGAAKDFLTGTGIPAPFKRYSFLLPAVIVLAIACGVILKTYHRPLTRATLFIKTLLVICITLELGTLVYNTVSGEAARRDLGDLNNDLAADIELKVGSEKPVVFWIVMDEYSGSTGLINGFNFKNPLNTDLRGRGFFVADSARSPYNYTHYSLAATLDMVYLKELQNHSVIGFRDIVRGNISLQETNTLKLLESEDYNIYNFTIYNLKNHPTRATEYFLKADAKLINSQTLEGRINQDIAWNFRNMFSADRRTADSLDHREELRNEYVRRKELMKEVLKTAREARDDVPPSLFMMHFMQTHEPFIYNSDGTLDLDVGYGVYRDRYIPSVNYANRELSAFIDSLKNIYTGRSVVIVLQGDHGYKFEETDPLFEQEGCSILYAVYCSDGNYEGWSNSFNSVNTFRVFFNKYFGTDLPLLENRSYNLYYR